MFDYRLWKLNPLGFHLGNVILHILNAFLLYAVIFFLIKDNILSFFCSLVYSMHPAHTSVVSYISGRADILGSLFFLLSFFLYAKSGTVSKKVNPVRELRSLTVCADGGIKPPSVSLFSPPTSSVAFSNGVNFLYVLSITSFILCLLSKESVLIFPFVLLLYELIFVSRKKFLRLIPFFLLVGIYLFFRIDIAANKAQLLLKDPHISFRLITSLKTFFEYVYILFLPLGLHMERTLSPHRYFPYEVFLFLCVAVSCIIILKHSKYFKFILFGIFYFIINLLPVLNILPLHAPLAENWLYIPSMGFVLAVVLAIREFFDENKVFFALVVLACAILSVLTVTQNARWRDEHTLYSYILNFEQASYKIHNNLGNVYYKDKDMERAMKEYETANNLNPSHLDPYINLAVINIDLKNVNKAEFYLKEAERLDPENPLVYFNKARLFLLKSDRIKARQNLKIALDIYPDYYDAYKILKEFLEEEPDFKEALRRVKEEPDSAEMHYKLGSIYLKNFLFYDAIEELCQAIILNNEFSKAHNNLGCAYARIGEFGLAMREFKLAVKLDKNYADAYSNMGIYYAQRNNFKKARVFLNKALGLSPEHKKSRDILELISKSNEAQTYGTK